MLQITQFLIFYKVHPLPLSRHKNYFIGARVKVDQNRSKSSRNRKIYTQVPCNWTSIERGSDGNGAPRPFSSKGTRSQVFPDWSRERKTPHHVLLRFIVVNAQRVRLLGKHGTKRNETSRRVATSAPSWCCWCWEKYASGSSQVFPRG